MTKAGKYIILFYSLLFSTITFSTNIIVSTFYNCKYHWLWDIYSITYIYFFYNIINHKQILTKYYNHQEHTYCYLGGYKNTMLEQKLLKQITKIKILKEERKVKKKVIK